MEFILASSIQLDLGKLNNLPLLLLQFLTYLEKTDLKDNVLPPLAAEELLIGFSDVELSHCSISTFLMSKV